MENNTYTEYIDECCNIKNFVEYIKKIDVDNKDILLFCAQVQKKKYPASGSWTDFPYMVGILEKYGLKLYDHFTTIDDLFSFFVENICMHNKFDFDDKAFWFSPRIYGSKENTKELLKLFKKKITDIWNTEHSNKYVSVITESMQKSTDMYVPNDISLIISNYYSDICDKCKQIHKDERFCL